MLGNDAAIRGAGNGGPQRGEGGGGGSSGPIHGRFGELLDVLAVVRVLVRDVVDEPGPAAPDAHDAISFAQCADRNRAYGRVESGDVAAAGQDRNCALG